MLSGAPLFGLIPIVAITDATRKGFESISTNPTAYFHISSGVVTGITIKSFAGSFLKMGGTLDCHWGIAGGQSVRVNLYKLELFYPAAGTTDIWTAHEDCGRYIPPAR